MATQKLWFEDEEFGCMNCGEPDYTESITEGLCIECNPTDPRYIEPEE